MAHVLLYQKGMCCSFGLSLSPQVNGGRVDREVLANKRDGRLLQILVSPGLQWVVDTRAKGLTTALISTHNYEYDTVGTPRKCSPGGTFQFANHERHP